MTKMMTILSRRLLECLTDKPISKWDLQEMLASWDQKKKVAYCPNERAIRRAVTELRENGYNIASSSDCKGYWLGSDEDKRRTVNELRSRAKKLLATADALERGPLNDQMEMEL